VAQSVWPSSSELLKRGILAPLGDKVVVKNDLNELIESIAAVARSGDQILVMSNGGFGGIHEKLLRRLHL